MTSPPFRLAVDLRALVPAATGIGVYTRELLSELSTDPTFSALGLCHAEPQGIEALLGPFEADSSSASGLSPRTGLEVEIQPAPLGVLWQQWKLPKRLAKGDIDLFWSPLQTLPRSCPVPSVVTVHDLTVYLFPQAHTLKVRWSQKAFFARSLRQAQRVIAVSKATAADLRRLYPWVEEKLRVVPNGVSSTHRAGSPEEVAAIRQGLGLPQGYILYAGTLEPRKNVGRLLDAWSTLLEDDSRTLPLILAGGVGWGAEGVLERIERLQAEHPGRLLALGRVDTERLEALYRGASLFAYPSLYEGFGLPVLEAMASGVPVLTSNRSSLPEVVGDAAILVDPERTQALYEGLRRCLDDPGLTSDLAARGLERSRSFTWKRSAEGHAEVFRQALATGR